MSRFPLFNPWDYSRIEFQSNFEGIMVSPFRTRRFSAIFTNTALLTFSLPLILTVIGCDSGGRPMKSIPSQAPDMSGVTNGFKDAWDGASSAISGAGSKPAEVRKMAAEEWEKLFRIEYRVVDIPKSDSAEKVEVILTKLGQDMWDCFHLQPLPFDAGLRAVCKRRPRSYLTYLRYMPWPF